MPSGATKPDGWAAQYRRRLIVTDVVIILGVVAISQALRFSSPTHVRLQGTGGVGYWAVSALLALCWAGTLALHGAWDAKSLGTGPAEFRRVAVATFAVISATAIFSFVTGTAIARGYLGIAFPLGLFGLLGGRWVWRRLLIEYRKTGNYLNSVLVIGGHVSAPALAARLRRHYEAGYRVTGLCMSTRSSDLNNTNRDNSDAGAAEAGSPRWPTVDGFAVLGDVRDVNRVIETSGVDTVAVAASEAFGPEDIRRLAWHLEGSSIQLILAPALTDVTGPRIHVEPVAGLPLMDVRAPTFRGPKHAAKIVLDYAVATAGLLLLSPVLLTSAAIILLTSGRPVFYRPLRVGRGVRLFRLFRFRSTTQSGDRITRFGRVMRRLGIDQGPELLNVVAGHMSMVGTRPIDPEEVVDEDTHLERRIRLRPGLTGPSQVLGRSKLSSADQVQLDLRYIENWTISGDLVLMVRAAEALFHRRRLQSITHS